MAPEARIDSVINDLFRKESRKILAGLVRALGPDQLDLAENAVQDALLKAIQVWPTQGIPENPAAWITTVAKNRAIDSLRGNTVIYSDEIPDRASAEAEIEHVFEGELKDEELRLLFITCHPALPRESQVALALKTLYGLTAAEIARAFLMKEETIEQRLVRAKRKIHDLELKFEVPAKNELRPRVDSALDVLYLLFNEGYSCSEGDRLTRDELCLESIRLTELLAEAEVGDKPKIHALLALMYFQASRLRTRIDPNGEVLLLSDQDRKLWSPEFITQGLGHLVRSAEGTELTEFHLLAGVAATHALADRFESTDWGAICSYYDQLAKINPGPVIALNRAVAIAMRDGPEAGLRELDLIRHLPALKRYYLLPATYGELLRKVRRFDEACFHLQEALALVKTAPERQLLQRRLDACSAKSAT